MAYLFVYIQPLNRLVCSQKWLKLINMKTQTIWYSRCCFPSLLSSYFSQTSSSLLFIDVVKQQSWSQVKGFDQMSVSPVLECVTSTTVRSSKYFTSTVWCRCPDTSDLFMGTRCRSISHLPRSPPPSPLSLPPPPLTPDCSALPPPPPPRPLTHKFFSFSKDKRTLYSQCQIVEC